MTTTAAFRRVEFTRTATQPIKDYFEQHGVMPPADDQIWLDVAQNISTNGPALGRTSRWKAACAWFDNFKDRPAEERQWAITQAPSTWPMRPTDPQRSPRGQESS